MTEETKPVVTIVLPTKVVDASSLAHVIALFVEDATRRRERVIRIQAEQQSPQAGLYDIKIEIFTDTTP